FEGTHQIAATRVGTSNAPRQGWKGAHVVHWSAILLAASVGAVIPGIAIAAQCNGTSATFNDHVVAFADQPADWQAAIRATQFPNDLPPTPPAPSLQNYDPKQGYLIPNHPGTQPMPPDSAWCHYTGVTVPAGQRVPTQTRPSAEQALSAAAGGSS